MVGMSRIGRAARDNQSGQSFQEKEFRGNELPVLESKSRE